MIHVPRRAPLVAPLVALGLLCVSLVALPAAAAQVVTTGESETITDPTLDPTTTGEPTGSILIVAPTEGQMIEGEAPVAVTIMTEAMSDTIGKIEIAVDGAIVTTCEGVATCDAVVELEGGDHGVDATLFGLADEQLAAASVSFHVHATGADTTTGGTDTTGDSGTGTGGDEDKGGCACRSGDGDAGGVLGLALGLGLVPLLRRRRAG